MLYKLFNRIFGWDYVAWTNLCDCGVARVHLDGRGNPYYWKYGKYIYGIKQDDPYVQVVWLTCDPSKYLKYTVA